MSDTRYDLDPAAVFGFLMATDDGGDSYEAMFCRECQGWTVYWIGEDPKDEAIHYSSCEHDDVCPDCRTDTHPGCCGPFA